MFYDSMIAKLISRGADAQQRHPPHARALDEFHIRGVAHNIASWRR